MNDRPTADARDGQCVFSRAHRQTTVPPSGNVITECTRTRYTLMPQRAAHCNGVVIFLVDECFMSDAAATGGGGWSIWRSHRRTGLMWIGASECVCVFFVECQTCVRRIGMFECRFYTWTRGALCVYCACLMDGAYNCDVHHILPGTCHAYIVADGCARSADAGMG